MTDRFLLADAMASGIHDVRNCLFVAESNLLNEECDRVLAKEMIMLAGSRLGKMLSAYHLLRHDQTLTMVPVNVNDLIEEVILQAVETSVRKVDIFSLNSFKEEWIFSREVVNDILVNALQNACRYAEKRIEIIVRVENEQLFIEIHDDGSGYPDVAIPTHPDPKGHGIGLFIAKQVTRHHVKERGGYIYRGQLTLAVSTRLGGALFSIQLP